ISCPVEYLHFGGGKAAGAGGRRQKRCDPAGRVRRKGMRTKRGKKRLEGKRFFITLLSGHDITCEDVVHQE
ncbi:hypothetical protein, partial [Okeania sp. SIO3B5]|uniref:hypothetical protein n=1 Tax=Okeania sp. SIO3B5 TaxID=2607811 RepID=UPI0025E19B48